MDRRAAWCRVRRADSTWLHKMAMRLQRLNCEEGLTEGQDRLWDQIIAELEWRSARKRRAYDRCACEFCINPFVGDERGEAVEVEF